MVLADSSAWIAFLRDDGVVAHRFDDRLRAQEIVMTDPVMMEVLAGARTPVEEEQLSALLGVARRHPCERVDYVEAARIHRACRTNGEQVRSMLDCLIAAVAIRVAIPVLHNDRDFDTIARHSTLQLA